MSRRPASRALRGTCSLAAALWIACGRGPLPAPSSGQLLAASYREGKPVPAGGLGGTSWQLVKIMSTDDRSRYTLDFPQAERSKE
jgi:hypothetical protein